MSKHTEGPWLASEGYSKLPYDWQEATVYTQQRGILEPVAYVRAIDAEESTPEALANAALICAAPDFLAACEGPGEDVTPLEWLSALLMDLAGSNYPATTEDPQATWDALENCGRLLDNLQAATKKAKGE